MPIDAGTRGKRRALCWLAGVALVGCAHAESEKTASVSELTRTVQSLRAQNAAYAHQVEELENRVFILSDQLDSKKVNAEKVSTPKLPALPQVTLHPKERAADPVIEEVNDEGEVSVEYAGEAAKANGKRPLLKLYGDDQPVMSTVERADDREQLREPPPRKLIVAPAEARGEKPHAIAGLELYRRSLEALRAGRHVEAAAGFRDFLKQHANHDFADNAQYWLGECYYDQKDYPTALREFRRVVEKYPSGNKVPDALLKVGFAHLALGSTEVGRQTLEQVVRSYPRHEAATLAGAKLAELGHTAANTDSRSRSAQEAP